MSRDRNKARMIALISTTLTKMGCYVVLSSGDADVQIVKYSITIPSKHHNVGGRGYIFAHLDSALLRKGQLDHLLQL